MIYFTSTRNQNMKTSFDEALLNGLSPDGGLYVPTRNPYPDQIFYSSNYLETAQNILIPFIHKYPNTEHIIREAFPFSPKLVNMYENLWVLELFHGPSHSFKDYGVSFLAAVLDQKATENNIEITVLTATSGDTGSAVARAFHGKTNLRAVVLFPAGRISEIQRRQITTLGGNIVPVEVAGSFDDCQRMVKKAFNDREVADNLVLTSANSINIGRFLPQLTYYAYAVGLLHDMKIDPVFAVPSGNFGNLAAGLFAWFWGLPVKHFIAATNANDTIPLYLKTGNYQPKPSVQTISNAMDVGDPSNFERIKFLFQDTSLSLSANVSGTSVNDENTLKTIKEIYEKTNYVADPHTAVGLKAAIDYQKASDDPVVVLSTAHPGKFPDTVKEATGRDIELPENLRRLRFLNESSVNIENTYGALKVFLLNI